MAIDKLNSNINQALNAARAEQQPARTAQQQSGAPAQPPRQDAVSLTQQAQRLTQLQKRAEADSGIDQAKVQRIKKALADGTYSIDAERLAAKIAHFENDMFGTVESHR